MMAEVFKSAGARLAHTAGVITPFQAKLEPQVFRHWIYNQTESLFEFIHCVVVG